MERGPHRDFYRETEKLDYLTEEQKSIVCDYIDTWTENYPATYADGDTLTKKEVSYFMRLIEKLKSSVTGDLDNLAAHIRESNDEYDPEVVSDFLFMTDEQLEVKYEVFDILENFYFN